MEPGRRRGDVESDMSVDAESDVGTDAEEDSESIDSNGSEDSRASGDAADEAPPEGAAGRSAASLSNEGAGTSA